MSLQANIHKASRGIVLCDFGFVGMGFNPTQYSVAKWVTRGFKNPPYASY